MSVKLTDFDADVLELLRANFDVNLPGLVQCKRAANRLVKKGLAEPSPRTAGKIIVTTAGHQWLADNKADEKRRCKWCGERLKRSAPAGQLYCSAYCASAEGEVDRICKKDNS